MLTILDLDIEFFSGVGPRRKDILTMELQVNTWGDLLEYYPYKYVDRSKIYTIRELNGAMPFVQIRAKILSFEEHKINANQTRLIAHVADDTGVADIIWWKGAKYRKGMYKVGQEFIIFGKPTVYAFRWQFSNPEMTLIDSSSLIPTWTGNPLQPYYITTERMKKMGLMSKQLEKLTQTLVNKISWETLPETLPETQVARLKLMSRNEALKRIHYPKTLEDVQRAQFRLKFEELFYVQLNILRYMHANKKKYRGYQMSRVGELFNEFYYKHLPFELTGAQKRVIREMREDMRGTTQMNRLLQGDVGSGKTLVALLTMLIVLDNGYQACLMAPTEILAEQHVQTLKDLLGDMNVKVELLTGSVKGSKRREILEGLARGEVNIIVGTHALIEEKVQFKQLGLAVIDEQHRFGVEQRAKLWRKDDNPPHILVMTATPIPRTLAMTLYGDEDVSVLDGLPPGRKPISTVHYLDNHTQTLYKHIQREIELGRQVYCVYPLIQESEKIELKDLEEGYNALQEAFPHLRLSKIHGRMKPKEKEEEMARCVSGETQILAATTVIEVGVNVPNASVMVIFEAQRFGLSQLHQLRGRVGRGAEQSYCILVTKPNLVKDTQKRIDIMCSTNDGFQIAEADLQLWGSGEHEGTAQRCKDFDLKIANIATDGQIVQLAREEAQAIIERDPECNAPEHQIYWDRLRELRDALKNWGVIS